MAMNIERLLRMTADYHNFCEDNVAKGNLGEDPDELGIDELDFVAAASAMPIDPDYEDPFKK